MTSRDRAQNRLDAWDAAAIAAVSPDTVLVHGKLRRDAPPPPG